MPRGSITLWTKNDEKAPFMDDGEFVCDTQEGGEGGKNPNVSAACVYSAIERKCINNRR